MVVYHADRRNWFRTGDVAQLDTSYKFLSHDSTWVKKCFPHGLSPHGNLYLCDQKRWPVHLNGAIPYTEMLEAVNGLKDWLIEYNLEIMRQAYFSNLPSRYTSFFALPTLQDFKKWPQLTEKKPNIYEINIPDDQIKVYDATFLIPLFSAGVENNGAPYLGVSPEWSFSNSFSYWNQEKQPSENLQKLECVLSPPFTIGRIVTID